MSDPNSFEYQVVRQLNVQRRRFDKQVGDIPALYLPWTQRVLNPFPLVSSGLLWGDMNQPWPIRVLVFYCSVYIAATNNATNFWTVDLIDINTTVVASVATNGIGPNAWTRLLDTTITQPSTTTPILAIRPTATLSPGEIYIAPAVPLLRT